MKIIEKTADEETLNLKNPDTGKTLREAIADIESERMERYTKHIMRGGSTGGKDRVQ
ncbi:MAG: hypothetical protein ABR981_04570 [Candidatus Micrarchaeaceae archaeon]|jgi:hypothetical protein